MDDNKKIKQNVYQTTDCRLIRHWVDKDEGYYDSDQAAPNEIPHWLVMRNK